MSDDLRIRASLREFGWGVLRRWGMYIAGIALSVLDLIERRTGEPVKVPGGLAWAVLSVGLIVAMVAVFHDERTRRIQSDTARRNRPLESVVRHAISDGRQLLQQLPRDRYDEWLGADSMMMRQRAKRWAAGVYKELAPVDAEVAMQFGSPHQELEDYIPDAKQLENFLVDRLTTLRRLL